MYDAATRADALRRIEAGSSLRSVSVSTGINRATLREWRERDGAYAPRLMSCPCPRCDNTVSDMRESYVYLLGQYLGDGSIQRAGRSVALRVFCCDSYPGIMDESNPRCARSRAGRSAACARLVAQWSRATRSAGCICCRSTGGG